MIFLLFLVEVFSKINLPSDYIIEYEELKHSGKPLITGIIYQQDKSLVYINNLTFKLNICQVGNETILNYDNSRCKITCIYGKTPEGEDCGSCSPYKVFYWLSLSDNIGKCVNNGQLYQYLIEKDFYVQYCFNENNPIFIKIIKNNIIKLLKITKWKVGKEKISIPAYC